MALDHVPVAQVVGEERSGLEHDGGGAVQKRAPNNVSVAGNPSNISDASIDIILMNVKDVAMSGAGVDEISSGGVNNALRLAGRAGGVECEEGVFAVHPFAGAVGTFGSNEGGKIEITRTAVGRQNLGCQVTTWVLLLLLITSGIEDDNRSDKGTCEQGGINDGFETDFLFTSMTFGCRQDNSAAAVLNSRSQCLG